MPTDDAPGIFVSHSVHDAALALDVVKLVESAAVIADSQVVCTSAPGHGIPGGAEPISYLRRSVSATSLVLFVVAPSFLDSSFCAYEAGAAWALFGGETDPPQLFVLLSPEVSYSDLPSVLQLQAARFDDRKELSEIHDRLRSLGFQSRKIDRWDAALTEFVNANGRYRSPAPTSTSPIDVAYVGRPHSCEVFYLLGHDEAWHSWYPVDEQNDDWDKWYRFVLPDEGVDALAAASWGEGHTEVFALCRDGVVRRRWWTPHEWSNWVQHHPETQLAGRLSVASRSVEHLEVCGTSTTGAPVRSFRRSSGDWSPWYKFPTPLQD